MIWKKLHPFVPQFFFLIICLLISFNGKANNFNTSLVGGMTPVLTCPSDVTIGTDLGQCSAVMTFSAPIASSSGCASNTVVQTGGLVSGATFPRGVSTQTFVMTDCFNNTTDCSFKISVIDTEPPVISCPASFTRNNDPGNCRAFIVYTPPVVTDNCMHHMALAGGLGDVNVFPVGTTTETYMATDFAGHFVSCSFEVTVQDVEFPSVTCPANRTANNDPGFCGAIVNYPSLTYTDNCPGFINVQRLTGAGSGNLFPVGTTTDHYLVTDIAGHTDTCSLTITVYDIEPPQNVCPSNISRNNDFNVCGAIVSYEFPSAIDNCLQITANLSSGLGSGSVFPIGTSTEEFIIQDNSGGTSICNFTITVTDTQNPKITCPINIVVPNELGLCWATVTYNFPNGSDNCPAFSIYQTQGAISGSSFFYGINQQTFQIQDASGNTVDCSFTIEVEDVESLSVTCPSNIIQNNDPGICGAIISYDLPNVSDNCPNYSINLFSGLGRGATFPVGISTEVYQVTDVGGFTVGCTFLIQVNDIEIPTIICPPHITAGNDFDNCIAVVTYVPITNDNCAGAIVTHFGPSLGSGEGFPLGVSTEYCRITDGAGNQATCSFTIEVFDTQPPHLVCGVDQTVSNLPSFCFGLGNYAQPVITENCPGNVTIDLNGFGSGSIFPVGVSTEIITVTDVAGNSTSCEIDITVRDTEPPSMTCPPDVTLANNPGVCGALFSYNLPHAEDNCTPPVITQTSGGGSGALCPIGPSEEVYVAVDDSGNQASCGFTVTTLDVEPPTITCPQNITQNTNPSTCTAFITYGMPIATDNCSGYSVNLLNGFGTGNVFPLGTSSESYQAIDPSGNTASCFFTITINDAEAPTITCPQNIQQNNDLGLCSAVVTFDLPTISDPCNNATISSTGAGSGATFPVGVSLETFQVVDAAGNVSSCMFTIEVLDAEDPQITCPANLTTNNDAGLCSAMVNYSLPTRSDNCGTIILSFLGGLGSNSNFPVGTTIEAYSVADGNGNIATCSFSITVLDVEPPQLTLPSNITKNNDSGLCGAIVTYNPPIGNDNCSNISATLIAGLGTGSFFPVGVSSEKYLIDDGNGNRQTFTFEITVLDVELPRITCPSNIIQNNDLGLCFAVITYQVPTTANNLTSENCPNASTIRTTGLGSGSAFPVGTTLETYEITDRVGNQASCSFTITVLDTEDPLVTCPANITQNNDPGMNGAIVHFGSLIISDNCSSVFTLNLGLGSGSFFALGVHTESFQINDAAGNSTICSFTISIIDNQGPRITCPLSVTQNNDAGLCSAQVTFANPIATDNASTPSITQNTGLTSGSNFPVGTRIQTYTAMDNAGNTIACSFSVTVLDVEPPQLTLPSNIIQNNDLGLCGAIVTYNPPVGIDNCVGVTSTLIGGLGTGSLVPLGVTSESYLIEDGNGNRQTFTFEITVLDVEAPTITCPSNIIQNNDAGICWSFVTYQTPTTANSLTSENCPGAITSLTTGLGSGAAFPVGTTLETYEIIDAAGNRASCNFTITIIDVENPSVTCPANITQNNDSGMNGAIVNYANPTIADNCSNALTLNNLGLGSGSFFALGTHTETFQLIDAAGNSTECSFTIMVADNQVPRITCPDNITLNNDAGLCSAQVTFANPIATDNASTPTVTQVHGLTSGSIFPVGISNVIFQASDNVGNNVMCVFTITVLDAEPPVLNNPASITQNNDLNLCSAVVTYSDPTGSDNCGGHTITQIAGLGSGAAFPTGITTETYLVVDAAGNTALHSLTITVLDTEAPTIFCPANMTQNNDAGLCGAIVNYAPISVLNNCIEPLGFQFSGTGSGNLFGLGVNTETYTVTDNSGNMGECSFTVTVRDTEAPTINCPANQTIGTATGMCQAVAYNYSTPVGIDNCPTVTTSQTQGLSSGSAFPLGSTQNNFITTDANGFTAACSFSIMVKDTEAPTINCPAMIVQNVSSGASNAVVTYSFPTGSDNCSGSTISFVSGLGSGGTFALGWHTETFSIVDAAGNTNDCELIISVLDNQNPEITCPANINQGVDANACSATVTVALPTVSDNGAISSVYNSQNGTNDASGVYGIGTTTVVYTVIDNAGNSTKCSFDIVIYDNQAPTITCPENVSTKSTSGNNCEAQTTWNQPIGMDNCPGYFISSNHLSNSNFDLGMETVTYTITDVNGNTAGCSFVVKVENLMPLTITCPRDTMIYIPSSDTESQYFYSPPIVSCPNVCVNRVAGLGSGADFPVGKTTQIYEICEAGLTSPAQCSFVVEVNNSGVLPVELLDFWGYQQAGENLIFWETTNEINSDKYIVERSSDQINFETIGEVKSNNLANEINKYDFVDENPLKGINYYRLKIMDFDGSFEYSKTIQIKTDWKFEIQTIAPNPTNGEITVFYNSNINGKITATVYSMTGQMVKIQSVSSHQGENNAQLDLRDLPAGVYQLTLFNGEAVQTKRIIKK